MSNDLRYQAQVAALPGKGKPGDYSVLLVTSRETRRWIIPTGWPMKGRGHHEARTGGLGRGRRVRPHLEASDGAYTYDKRLANGSLERVRAMVYLLEVEKETGKWPEKDERKRECVSTSEARKRVEEEGLKKILQQLDVGPLDTLSEPGAAEPASFPAPRSRRSA